MKIKQIEIGGFGKWKNKIITFDENFQVVFGLNEAGKSTMYQFIRFILFEHEMRKNSLKDYQPKDHSLFGGRLIFEHKEHGEIKVERFKGYHKGQAKVYFASGEVGDQETLKRLIAPLNLTVFDEVFSLQQEELLRIINLNEDKLQELLLIVGLSGSQRLSLEQEKFAKGHEKLYRPGARVRPLNQEIMALRELETQISKKEKVEQAYREQMQTLQKLEQEATAEKNELARLDQSLTRLTQQKRLWGSYEEQQQLIHSLAADENQRLDNEQIKELETLEQEQQFIRKQIVDYQNLKESQLVNGQLSPALVFYQNNQQVIENLADHYPKYTKLQSRVDWLEEQGQKQDHQILELANELGVKAHSNLPKLRQGDYHLIQKIARRQQALLQNNERLENQLHANRLLASEEQEQVSQPKILPIAVLFIAILIVCSLLVLIGQVIPAVIFAIIASTLAMASYLQLRRGQQEIAQDDRLEAEIKSMTWQLAADQKELAGLEQEKAELATRFVFPLTAELDEWLYMWPKREQLLQLEAENKLVCEERDELRRELEVYSEQLKLMSDWLPVQTEETRIVYQQLLEFVKEMHQKQQDLNAQNVTNWHEPLQALLARKENLPLKLAAILPDNETITLREIPVLLSNQEWLSNRQEQLERLNQQLAEFFKPDKKYELSEIQRELGQQTERQKGKQAVVLEREKEIQQLDFSLRQQEADGTLSELYQARENLNEEIKNMGNDWLDNRLSETILQDLIHFLGTQHLSPLLATATHYFKELTLNNYQKCEFIGEQLQVTNHDGQSFGLAELSTGTQDQLYLAIRLAFIHLHSQEQLAPVIIDDGWLHYDSQRKRALFKLLANFSRDIQIICLSSDQELLDFAEDNYLPVVRL